MTRRDPDFVLEAELFELFAPHRPDPRAFGEGVEQRIAKLRAERGEGGERGDVDESDAPSGERDAKLETREAPAWVRKAASFLPPDFGALLLSSGKGWSAALLLPALTLGALFGAFFMGKRSIARSVREAAPAPAPPPRGGTEAPHQRESLLAVLLFPAVAAFLLVALFTGITEKISSVDVLLAILVLSVFSMTLQVRALSSAGTLARDTALTTCVGVMNATAFGCLMFTNSSIFGGAGFESVFGGWTTVVVAYGGLLALVVRSSAPIRTRSVVAILILGLLAARIVWGSLRSTEGRVQAFVESQPLDASREHAWSEVAESVEALRSVGAREPDSAPMRMELERAIRDGWDAHDVAWTAGARTGTIDREHWRLLAQRPEQMQRLHALLEEDGPFLWPAEEEYVLNMLLATHELDDEERARLTERVVQSWPEFGHSGAMARALQCVRWFEMLERRDLVEVRRTEIHELLRRLWGRARTFETPRGGGFAPFVGTSANVRSTVPAVELMARAGVPGDTDLRRVWGVLRLEVLRPDVMLDGDSLRRWAPATAALLRLERQTGLPERSWLAAIYSERLLIGVLLLVALCWTAIESAPPGPEHALRLARKSSGR
jgi:hypothetical protein